jgi:integrase
MKTRLSQKGQKFTSDYIEYEKAQLMGNKLLWNGKPKIGFYVLFAINTGLRVSDIQQRKHSELMNLKPGDYLTIIEKKTKKVREIQINTKLIEAYKYLVGKIGPVDPDSFIFTSQKGSVFNTESLNCILKKEFAGHCEHISTHSLRKSFGRHVYDCYNQSEHDLICLSEMFQHSSPAITRKYLGLRKQEIGNIYMSL